MDAATFAALDEFEQEVRLQNARVLAADTAAAAVAPGLVEALQLVLCELDRVAELDPDVAALARLRAIEQRGRDMVDPLCTCGGCPGCAVAFVLDGPTS